MHHPWRSLAGGLVACIALSLSGLHGYAAAQDPDSAMIAFRALGLDSIRLGAGGTYYRAVYGDRARNVHEYHVALSQFARDSLGISITTRVAVLSQADWAMLTSLPYGFPHNFGPPANIIPVPAVRAPASGADTLLIGDGRDLALVSHEGGHILTWSLMPGAMLDSLRVGNDRLSQELRVRFERFDAVPEWYWEFSATYLGIAYLRSQYPDAAGVFTKYLEGLTAVGVPTYRSLDAWFETMMVSRTDAGVPFVATPAGNVNFAWYQGIVGVMADHVYGSRQLAHLEQLRALAAGSAMPTTVVLIEEMERASPGLVQKLDRLGVLWRE